MSPRIFAFIAAGFAIAGSAQGASVFWAFQSDSSMNTSQTGPNYNDLASIPTITLQAGTDGASISPSTPTGNNGTGGANGFSYNGVTYGGSGGSGTDGRSLVWSVTGSATNTNSLVGSGFTVSGLNFTGLEDVNLSFDIRSATANTSSPAPTTFARIEYSIIGGTWVDITSNVTVPTWPGGTASTNTGFVARSIDFSAITAIENQSNVSLRFVFSDGTVDPIYNQNIRVDNLLINAVPEPSSIGLALLGGLALFRRQRR